MSQPPPRHHPRNTVPEYSATGDVLAYRACALQYRYYNRNRLPPSRPVQVWFGEFVHGVLEEAYRRWKAGELRFPCDWLRDVREIELAISRELQARGIPAPPNIFCRFTEPGSKGSCPDERHPHQLLASRRVMKTLDLLGPWLFPLISQAEVRLRGTRRLSSPSFRATAYSVTGVADVLAAAESSAASAFEQAPPFVQLRLGPYLRPGSEIIIDYKGMRRPAIDQPEWHAHELQILTYAWLRNRQVGEDRVRACLLIYVNELEPAKDDIERMKDELAREATDVPPSLDDFQQLERWQKSHEPPELSLDYRLRRCLRLIPVDEPKIDEALRYFDETVAEIEKTVEKEARGEPIPRAWTPRYRHETCVACDFLYICPDERAREHVRSRGR
jgi:hypothetical protein